MTTTTVRTINLNCPEWCAVHHVEIDEPDPHGGRTVHTSQPAFVETGRACGLAGEVNIFRVALESATRLSDGEPIVHFAAAELPVYVRLEDTRHGPESTLRPEEARALAAALLRAADQVDGGVPRA